MFKTIKSPDVTILALKNIRRWIKNMLSSIKLIVKLILCFFVSLSIILLSIKTLTYKKFTSSEKKWNEDNSCYAITYIPDYKPFGGVGRVLRLFSKQSFFVVYDKTGKK